MTKDLPDYPGLNGRIVDAVLNLSDRQVLDSDDVPVSTVDDIEISWPKGDPVIPSDADPPVIENLIVGSGLGTRIFGGSPPSDRLYRIPWSDVAKIGTAITLGKPGASFEVTWVERWTRDHIIVRIPGGKHAPE